MSKSLADAFRAQQESDKKIMTAILEAFKPGDDISVSLIQRKCNVGFFSAHRLFDQLKTENKVKPGENNLGVSKFL